MISASARTVASTAGRDRTARSPVALCDDETLILGQRHQHGAHAHPLRADDVVRQCVAHHHGSGGIVDSDPFEGRQEDLGPRLADADLIGHDHRIDVGPEAVRIGPVLHPMPTDGVGQDADPIAGGFELGQKRRRAGRRGPQAPFEGEMAVGGPADEVGRNVLEALRCQHCRQDAIGGPFDPVVFGLLDGEAQHGGPERGKVGGQIQPGLSQPCVDRGSAVGDDRGPRRRA